MAQLTGFENLQYPGQWNPNPDYVPPSNVADTPREPIVPDSGANNEKDTRELTDDAIRDSHKRAHDIREWMLKHKEKQSILKKMKLENWGVQKNSYSKGTEGGSRKRGLKKSKRSKKSSNKSRKSRKSRKSKKSKSRRRK